MIIAYGVMAAGDWSVSLNVHAAPEVARRQRRDIWFVKLWKSWQQS